MSRKYPYLLKEGSVVVRIYQSKHNSTKSGFIYTLSYRDHLNKRQTPQFASVVEAEKEGRRIALALAAGEIASAAFSASERDELLAAKKMCGEQPLLACIEEYLKAKAIAGSNLFHAAKHWSDSNNKNFKAKLVSEIVDEYLAAKLRLGKDLAKSHGSAFREIKSDLGGYFLNDLTTSAMTSWLEKKKHPVTYNTYRKRLVSISNWSRKFGYLPRGTPTEAEHIERAVEQEPEIGIMAPTDFARLLEIVREYAPSDLASLVIAGFCGLRRCEVHAQKWSDIDLKKKILTVSRAKRGTLSYRTIPLTKAALAWLELCVRNDDARISKGMAIDRVRKLGRDHSLIIPDNAFRHSFVTYRIAQLKDVNQPALEAGHSLKEQTKHYKQNASHEDGVAWFNVFPAAEEIEAELVA